jgi:ABC-2 type transport system ATP-binding protein
MSIAVNNISKSYGAKKALDNISFSVNKGESLVSWSKRWENHLMKILTTTTLHR